MDGVSCQCLRLRKKENMTTCPILLQFPDDRSASKFVRSKRLVAAQTNFKNIIIKHDQTPLQRRLTMKQNPPPIIYPMFLLMKPVLTLSSAMSTLTSQPRRLI
ncbi:unnamed protein product [Dicrocoelium dendriticum]|nr:unnamed protein product [Dicrocoelium dendriticum]